MAIEFEFGKSSMGGLHHVLGIKLVPTNYLVWVNQFEPIINCYDLGSFIDPSAQTPPQSVTDDKKSAPNLEYITWFKKDQMLRSWILSSLSEEVTIHTVGLKTSAAIWNALQTAYGAPTHTRLVQLNMQLQNFKRNELSITEYFRQFKMIVDELGAAEKGLDLATINAIIFNNLGPEFSDIVAALSVRKEPLSLPELTNAFLGHEIRIGNKQSIDLQAAENMTMAKGGGRGYGGRS